APKQTLRLPRDEPALSFNAAKELLQPYELGWLEDEGSVITMNAQTIHERRLSVFTAQAHETAIVTIVR
ncbi:hypothetical protein M9458_005360, partial [Cirrhinus mrigala]